MERMSRRMIGWTVARRDDPSLFKSFQNKGQLIVMIIIGSSQQSEDWKRKGKEERKIFYGQRIDFIH